MTSSPNVPSNYATTRHVALTQYDLNRAVAEATMESVGVIDGLGFSLLAMPPTYPLAIYPEQRRYPLRIARETRKRKPSRKRAKLSGKPIAIVRTTSG